MANPTSTKICLVCGGSSGIGIETARGLAETGATVVLTGTSKTKAETVAASLPGNCIGAQLDFTDFQSVTEFARDFLERNQQLDVLVHNAGLVLPKRQLTQDGFECTFAVTYLGPYLLTSLLEPLLVTGPQTRIVNVCSDLHWKAKMDFDNLQSEKGYDFIGAFARAELAKMMWTLQLSRHYPIDQATANSLHPGGVKTNLFRHFRGPLKWLISLSNMLKSSPKKGAQTSLHLALSPDVQDISGQYFIKSFPARCSPEVEKAQKAEKLWALSREYVEKFLPAT